MNRAGHRMPAALAAIACLIVCVFGRAAYAVEIDLATVSCQRYQDEILHPPAGEGGAAASVDPIDTTMWLLGFSLAKAGAHVMYSDALTSFGFALDAECRNNPGEPLLRAVTTVKVKQDHPMDLQQTTCDVWAKRHDDLQRKDPESANTLMMWMYGFSVAKNDAQTLLSDGSPAFTAALASYCTTHATANMFDALVKTRPPGVVAKPKARARH